MSRLAVVSASNSGFWLSAATLGLAVGLAAWLLPNQPRVELAERAETETDEVFELALSPAAGS